MNAVARMIWIPPTGFLTYSCNALLKTKTGPCSHLMKPLICMISLADHLQKLIPLMKPKLSVAKSKTLKSCQLPLCGARCWPCYLKRAIPGSPSKTFATYVHHNNMLVSYTAQTYAPKLRLTRHKMKLLYVTSAVSTWLPTWQKMAWI